MKPKILWQDRPAPAPAPNRSKSELRYASFWDELLDYAEDMAAHPEHHQATTAWQFEERLAEQLQGFRSEREIFTDPRALDAWRAEPSPSSSLATRMYANLKRDTLDAVFGPVYAGLQWSDLPTSFNTRRKNILFAGMGRVRFHREALAELLAEARAEADKLLLARQGLPSAHCWLLGLLALWPLTPFLKIVLALFVAVVVLVALFGKPSDLPPGAGTPEL